MINGKKIMGESVSPPTTTDLMSLFGFAGAGVILIAFGIYFIWYAIDRFL